MTEAACAHARRRTSSSSSLLKQTRASSIVAGVSLCTEYSRLHPASSTGSATVRAARFDLASAVSFARPRTTSQVPPDDGSDAITPVASSVPDVPRGP